MNLNLVKAGSGNEALSLLLETEVALILLDVQMPGMDGFEVARLMRLSPRTQHVPIIFVTAISKEEKYVFEGYESGAVDYLFKPIEQSDQWQFSIQDNGIGFDMKFADRVFGLCQRLHTNEEYAGTGIGLTICKRIVERHHGTISVESVPDVGTNFQFAFPQD